MKSGASTFDRLPSTSSFCGDDRREEGANDDEVSLTENTEKPLPGPSQANKFSTDDCIPDELGPGCERPPQSKQRGWPSWVIAVDIEEQLGRMYGFECEVAQHSALEREGISGMYGGLLVELSAGKDPRPVSH